MLLDSDVQELLDRARIADTIYAFCDYCIQGDIDSVVDLFTDSGLMDLGGGAIHSGHDELRDMFADRFTLYKASTFHCSGVRLVRYDGQTATTSTYLYGIHDAADLDRQMHVWGRYMDEMVNESGVWRFQRRDLCVSGMSLTDIYEVPERFGRSDEHRRSAPKAARNTSGGASRQPVSVLSPTRIAGDGASRATMPRALRT